MISSFQGKLVFAPAGLQQNRYILNLTQYIEDDFEEGEVTGVVFCRPIFCLWQRLPQMPSPQDLELTKDTRGTELIESMLENMLFFVELASKKSRSHRLTYGHLQGGVPAPMPFIIYTNDQPRREGTRHFIYADDLGVAAEDSDFSIVKERLSNVLSEWTPYYEKNHLRANSSKTQVCTFHLLNHEANHHLKVT